MCLRFLLGMWLRNVYHKNQANEISKVWMIVINQRYLSIRSLDGENTTTSHESQIRRGNEGNMIR